MNQSLHILHWEDSVRDDELVERQLRQTAALPHVKQEVAGIHREPAEPRSLS